jgi:flavodoxin
MKALVTYFSQTGNTERVAQAIYDALEVEKDLLPVKEISDVKGYDIVFCGFPVHAHSVPQSVQSFIKSLPPGKKVAIFSTHGSLRGGRLAVTAMEHAVSLASKARVLGTFGCRGRVDPQVIDSLMKQPEHRSWAEEARSAASQPDQSDLEDAREFAHRMMAKARR